MVACEQALLFRRVKRVSRERASERAAKPRGAGAHFAYPNRRACSQATFMAILCPLLEPACCLYNPYRRKEETHN